jgi:hypothetical protein
LQLSCGGQGSIRDASLAHRPLASQVETSSRHFYSVWCHPSVVVCSNWRSAFADGYPRFGSSQGHDLSCKI